MRSIFIFLIGITVLSGCSSQNVYFNDDDLKLELINQQSLNEINTYDIQLKNIGTYELTDLTMELSFPIILENGSKSNPYKINGKTGHAKPLSLKPNEEITFTFIAPIQEVFGDSQILNFKNPDIEINGFIKQGNNYIPFGMGGGLSALIK